MQRARSVDQAGHAQEHHTFGAVDPARVAGGVGGPRNADVPDRAASRVFGLTVLASERELAVQRVAAHAIRCMAGTDVKHDPLSERAMLFVLCEDRVSDAFDCRGLARRPYDRADALLRSRFCPQR